MKMYLFLLLVLGVTILSAAQTDKKSGQAILRIQGKHPGEPASAVRVVDAPLMFTGQVFASDLTKDARGQADQALDQLGLLLAQAGADLRSVVRLNAYVADDQATPAVEKVITVRFSNDPPAVTLVRSPLATHGALVTFDAVAVSSKNTTWVEIMTNAAIMPAGGKVFVSGQAQKGKDLTESVQLTLDSLYRSLGHIGLGKSDVVQIKAFIQPFSDHAAAVAVMEKTYAGGKVPPIVLLEWLSTSPTEIELIAAARPSPPVAGEPVAFLSLPGMATSPLYCRIATVSAGTPLIFIGSIDGVGDTGRDQWKEVFAQLGGVLFESGSSFRHLVKATYYLADASARQPLGEIRPTYYDPVRPPAASALDVTSLGRSGKRVMLDMIAVPAR